MNIRNFKIGARLALGFSAVLVLLVALTVLSVSQLAASNERVERIVSVSNAEIQHVTALEVNASERAVAIRNVVLLTEPAEMQVEVERVKTLGAQFGDRLAKLQAIFNAAKMSATEKRLMEEVVTSNAALLGPVQKAVGLGLDHKSAEATTVLMKEIRPPQQRLKTALEELKHEEQQQNELVAAEAASSYQSARSMLVAISIAAVAVGAFIAWLATRSVTRPLAQAVSIAQAVAAGDLTREVQVQSTDETGQLLQALKHMNESLARVVGTVRRGTDTIATASGQIAVGNQDLSQRTEEQASSLEETAASMEELTGTVKQNADNAQQANRLAQSAAQVATKGGAVVGEVVETMGAIDAASRKIVDIISVIDGIAFQTNILALNAAVEAARAGEQGRGFAVVAAEVRTLAQRSASAAKEIKALIDDSVTKVGAGTQLVGQAGQTMQEIVAGIKRVTDIMGEIAAATGEQTRGIEQVNTAITQMDQVTQQNAALVEEAAAAAQSLREQAANLVQAVSVFKVDAQQAAAAPSAAVEGALAAPAQAQARPAPSAASPRSRKAAQQAPRRAPANAQLETAQAGAGEWAEF